MPSLSGETRRRRITERRPAWKPPETRASLRGHIRWASCLPWLKASLLDRKRGTAAKKWGCFHYRRCHRLAATVRSLPGRLLLVRCEIARFKCWSGDRDGAEKKVDQTPGNAPRDQTLAQRRSQVKQRERDADCLSSMQSGAGLLKIQRPTVGRTVYQPGVLRNDRSGHVHHRVSLDFPRAQLDAEKLKWNSILKKKKKKQPVTQVSRE